MGTDSTNIPDPAGALGLLGLAIAHAENMQAKLASMAAAVDGVEKFAPWGHTADYAQPFKERYFAGQDKGGGPAFVRKSMGTLAEEALFGLHQARTAIQNSTDVDLSAAAIFHVDGTDQLAPGVTAITTETDAVNKKQKDQGEADK